MDLEKAKLVNLSSDNWNIQAELFRIERLVNMVSLFHDPVKQCRFVNFKETSKSVSMRKVTRH